MANTTLYQSPPGSGTNNGALPTQYDPQWGYYTNLTAAQVQAFQQFPQALAQYAVIRREIAELSGITVAGIPITTQLKDLDKIGQLKQAFDTGVITSVSFFDANEVVHTIDATTATAIYTASVQFVQSLYNTCAQLLGGINAASPTITTRKQIDAAIAAVAPNSPSALQPSPT